MSTPRQKMVAVASPQPNELEQKKRRQTLERAKANHLSKQLQMRLQYAKLKVEHGWQRQNLNEVENLYFHHSHVRTMRQPGARTYASVSYPSASVEQPGVPDRVGPSPSADNAPSSSGSPSLRPSSELALAADGQPVPPLQSPSQVYLTVQTPVPVAPTALDVSDPNLLARLAQFQAQIPPSQAQTVLSRQPSTTVPPTSTQSQPHPQFGFSVYAPTTAVHYPVPVSSAAQPAVPASTSASASTPGSVPAPGSVSVSGSTSTITSAPTPPIPTMPPIPNAPHITSTALTYDSFWSTHAAAAGPTRALYRHAGFSASAAGGNVAMLTPGGHAAVMTAEGVYVGGGRGG